ncbi:MAG: hypothetical protein KGJ41_06780 [Rhodospirillales bacterium]|nr:hypothetical protein [Rhodospirillales bacterium]MDE2574025.1 hypothetical protein [Rhodospirillales bacterium]
MAIGRVFAAILAGALLAWGVPAAAQLAAPPVRPPPRRETVPPSPGPDYVWSAGGWRWNGSAFRWVHGRYRMRRPYSYRYAHGYFVGVPPLLAYVPGHFDGPPPPP